MENTINSILALYIIFKIFIGTFLFLIGMAMIAAYVKAFSPLFFSIFVLITIYILRKMNKIENRFLEEYIKDGNFVFTSLTKEEVITEIYSRLNKKPSLMFKWYVNYLLK